MAGTDLAIADYNSESPLYIAAWRGDPKIIQSLLEHGALVNGQNWKQHTPLVVSPFAFRDADRDTMQRTVEFEL